jgi:hypothetical protein
LFQTKNISGGASFKDVDEKKGVITGYFAHFNNEDSDGDTIIPGAFSKTIKEQGPQSSRPRIKHLRNHLIYEPVGTIEVLKEDTQGLYYESRPGTHSIGQDTIKMIESGLITEHSIGFETVKKQVVDPDADWRNRKQILQELKLWEGSLLTGWGANEMTGGATMKSMGKEAYIQMIEKRIKALDKFCRNSDATDETIELLLIEHKQLTQIIIDLTKEATKPDESTLPESKGNDEIANTLNNFITSLNLQTWTSKNLQAN